MTEVYIELFLLDNILMCYIILLCAAPFVKRRLNKPLALCVSMFTAVYAVFSMNVPLLNILPFKIVLLAAMVVPFLPRNWKQAAICGGCVLISTCIMGGASYMVVDHLGAAQMRTLMAVAVLSSLLVRPIRSLVAKARLSSRNVLLRVKAPGIDKTLSGRIDTGNTLKEPVTGLPVIVVYGEPEVEEGYAVPYCSIGGSGVMKAVKCRASLVDDQEGIGERDCCLAFSPTPISDCDAVVNAELFAV